MKKHRKKAVKVDVTTQLHQLLRTTCRCTEEEIRTIDEILRGRAPAHVIEHLMAIHEGRVPLRMRGTLNVDMGNGEVMALRPTNHPHTLLYDYLREQYGERFGSLYWMAFGAKPQDYYKTLREMCNTPFFADMLAEDETRRSEDDNG